MPHGTKKLVFATFKQRCRRRRIYFDEWVRFPLFTSEVSRGDETKSQANNHPRYNYLHTYTNTWTGASSSSCRKPSSHSKRETTRTQRHTSGVSGQEPSKRSRLNFKPPVPKQRRRQRKQFSIPPYELWCTCKLQQFWRRHRQQRVIKLLNVGVALSLCTLAKVG